MAYNVELQQFKLIYLSQSTTYISKVTIGLENVAVVGMVESKGSRENQGSNYTDKEKDGDRQQH